MASKPAARAKPSAAPSAAPARKSASPAAAAAAAKKAAPKAAPHKAAPVAASKKAVETVTLRTVFEQLGEAHGLPKAQARALLNGFVAAVTGHLRDGDRVRMSGLGIIEVRDRPARTARNPATGAAVQVAASRRLAFRPAKELKEAAAV